jgi:hypothetical protein
LKSKPPKARIQLPPVYRYLPTRYVDEFFSSGKLRLSAFSEFARHIDEQRHDTEEGWVIVDIPIPSRQVALRSRAGIGHNAYILSTSAKGDIELMQAFDMDSYFKINNVLAFSEAIASKILGCTGTMVGYCKYASQKEIQREMGILAEKAVERSPEGKMYLDRVGALLRQVLFPDALFMKLGRYSHQQEFRLIWQVSYEVHEPLFVECTEAVQFCERVTVSA